MTRSEWKQRFKELIQELAGIAHRFHELMLDYPRKDNESPDVDTLRQDVKEILHECESRESGLSLRRLWELLRLMPSTGKRANQLEGKTWLRHSISIWSDLRKTKNERELKHPATFPSALAERLIECFTNEHSRVIFDPFAGIGSTLIAAKELGKDAIGIEISPEFAEIARRHIQKVLPFEGIPDIKVHVADSRDLAAYVPANSVDMVITSPPYWDILLEKRTADYKPSRDYGDTRADLGKIRDYQEFLLELRKVFVHVYDAMKPKSYCCVVVMDLRKKNRFYPFHMDISRFMEDIGFVLDDIVIWDRGQEYNNLRPLGYPSVFRVNRIHEFILIFQRPE